MGQTEPVSPRLHQRPHSSHRQNGQPRPLAPDCRGAAARALATSQLRGPAQLARSLRLQPTYVAGPVAHTLGDKTHEDARPNDRCHESSACREIVPGLVGSTSEPHSARAAAERTWLSWRPPSFPPAMFARPSLLGNGRSSRTSLALTPDGRAPLANYTEALRGLLNGV